jgi:hypothetical protein
MVTEAEARRIRPFMSGVVALVVALVVTVAWYYLGRPSDEAERPPASVDWQAWAKAGRSDGKLLLFAPASLPEGWRATSASYTSGTAPAWHLGVLTDKGRYIGVDETRDRVRDLVRAHVDEDATQGADVVLDGRTWQSWTDAGGDYALTWTREQDGLTVESVVVVSPAGPAVVRAFVDSLEPGRG